MKRNLHRLVLLALFLMFAVSARAGEKFDLPEIGSNYEIFSMAGAQTVLEAPKKLLKETPRNAISEDGLAGFFIAETADRLQARRLFSSFKYQYHDITSHAGKAFLGQDKGHVQSYVLSAVYIGDWAEWSVQVPIHEFSLEAPRALNQLSTAGQGVGDVKMGWKATYLPDKSYYRFAYGLVYKTGTGNTGLQPAGPMRDDEFKLYGCVTTKETDKAVGNFELGTILDSKGVNNRFIYRSGMSYEASPHATLIGELVGEIHGGNDQDNLDLLGGIRLAPSPTAVLEFSYTRNLRTYREYGWDDRYQVGFTMRY